MGKKLSQASLKISKNQKQQFNSLIKVLRPKVYITDSSSFKKLVQELTGNNGSSTPSSPPTLEPNLETSFEVSATSTEATTPSSEFCYTAEMNEDFNLACNQIYLDDRVLGDPEANQPQDHNLLGHQNLESLLFDVEDELNPFYNCYAQIGQEVSIYDYELLGLL